MNTDNRFIAEWYEDDSIDESEGFMSDVIHQSTHATLTEAKTVSMDSALKHGAMVCGSVIEQEYSYKFGWDNVAYHTAEYFDDEWQEWGKEAP